MSATTSSLSPALQALSDNGLLKSNLSQAELKKLSPEGLTQLALSNAKAAEMKALFGGADSSSGDGVGFSPAVEAMLSGKAGSGTNTSQRSLDSILEVVAASQLDASNAALSKAKSSTAAGTGNSSTETHLNYLG